MPHSLPRLEPCVLVDHPHGEGVRSGMSAASTRVVPGGPFEYAHVLSHMSEMGGAEISALSITILYYTVWASPVGARPRH
jgi:hypothetical protein